MDLIARWSKWRPSRLYGDLITSYVTLPERIIPPSDSYRDQERRSNSPDSDRISMGVAFEGSESDAGNAQPMDSVSSDYDEL